MNVDEKLFLGLISLMQGRKSKIVDSVKLKVIAKMEDVTVKLENDIREIAALEVSHDFTELKFLINNLALHVTPSF